MYVVRPFILDRHAQSCMLAGAQQRTPGERKDKSALDHLLCFLYSPLDPDDNLSYTSWLHFAMSLFEGNATH